MQPDVKFAIDEYFQILQELKNRGDEPTNQNVVAALLVVASRVWLLASINEDGFGKIPYRMEVEIKK
jgi:hypothetical protein